MAEFCDRSMLDFLTHLWHRSSLWIRAALLWKQADLRQPVTMCEFGVLKLHCWGGQEVCSTGNELHCNSCIAF